MGILKGIGKAIEKTSPTYGIITGKGTFGGLRKFSPTGQVAKKLGVNEGDEEADVTSKMAKGGKAKCYAEGGDTGAAKDPFDISIDSSKIEVDTPDITRDFGATFKDARSSGAKTFDWKGKSYNTKMKGEGTPTPTSTPTKAKAKAAPARAKAQNPFRDAEAKASKAKAATPKPARGSDFGTGDWMKEKPGGLRIGKPKVDLRSDKPAPTPTKKAAAPAPVKKAVAPAPAPAKKASTPDWAKGGARKLMEPKKRFGDKGFAKGGEIQRFAKGGSIDGIAKRGKTRCKKV